MEFHMNVVGERAAQAYAETLDATTQVHGTPSDAVTQMLRVQPAPACRSASTPRTSEDLRGSEADATRRSRAGSPHLRFARELR
jgi:hypothetical protein